MATLGDWLLELTKQANFNKEKELNEKVELILKDVISWCESFARMGHTECYLYEFDKVGTMNELYNQGTLKPLGASLLDKLESEHIESSFHTKDDGDCLWINWDWPGVD